MLKISNEHLRKREQEGVSSKTPLNSSTRRLKLTDPQQENILHRPRRRQSLCHTYQIPGWKTSVKGERKSKAGLDADGWSVSPNNSKNGRGILISPAPHRQPTAWSGRSKVLGGGGLCSYCPGRAARSFFSRQGTLKLG